MSVVNKEFYMDNENQKLATQVNWEVADCLRDIGNRSGNSVILSTYLLCKASMLNNPSFITFQAILDGTLDIDEETVFMTKKLLDENAWERLITLTERYSSELFALAALQASDNSYTGSTITPNSIIKLSQEILSINDNDDVADVGCGTGSYFITAAFENPNAHYTGYEINVESKIIAKLRAELIEADVSVELGDVFGLVENDEVPKFDKVFANYPFGLSLRNLGAGTKYLSRLTKTYPGLSKATSSDWVFNALICDILKKDGKAIGIMTNGSTWNSIDMLMRKYFIERGMVNCVISLPNRMFSTTNIPTTLIVLSHNNKSVRLIDATEICQQGRRQKEFNDENINTIITALNNDSKYSKEISIDELRENEYTLSLSRYLKDDISFTNGVPFESIIKSISRGAPFTANQLDEMVSDSVTNMQYLMLSNIQNGMIDSKLPYLSIIEPKYEKYCLKNNNLILSKNGYPYKVAIAKIDNDQKIIANGNLYVIELDESRVNPYFVKAFFESEQGISALKSITVGATIPNIGVDKLKRVDIPLPPMEEQERIAQKYQATLDEIAILKLRLEKAMSRLYHIFDEESEV